MANANYAHPETLVPTDWVSQHLKDPKVRIVEVDVDTSAYDQGHIPGALALNWTTELQDLVRRDIRDRAGFEALVGSRGISNSSTVVLYGDNHNWFAAWAFWQFKLYGHTDVRLMNGGRKKWIDEGRPLEKEIPHVSAAKYQAQEPDSRIRATREEVFEVLKKHDRNLVDVRSPQEFTGEVIAPPGMTETAQRGGHIPGAISIPWSKAVNDDGTFRSVSELRSLYEGLGVRPDRESIAYCRIGERSSHTWYVLKYLLGYPHVRNYDGSWTEYGNLVAAPIEKGEGRKSATA
ncbi:MAG: sulfurtransferase [Acidobacteriia bacterium]|nr:sulfurtransferase [Terriglobia bacterium]